MRAAARTRPTHRAFKCPGTQGIEVAWNQVELNTHMEDNERERMFSGECKRREAAVRVWWRVCTSAASHAPMHAAAPAQWDDLRKGS